MTVLLHGGETWSLLVRTFSLDLAASDSNDDCFSQQLSTTTSLHDCNDNLRDAFQCISVHRAA